MNILYLAAAFTTYNIDSPTAAAHSMPHLPPNLHGIPKELGDLHWWVPKVVGVWGYGHMLRHFFSNPNVSRTPAELSTGHTPRAHRVRARTMHEHCLLSRHI